MTELITRYRQILDEAATMFSELMEKQGEWSSDYTLWFTEYEAWTPEDMLYILEHYKHLYQSRTSAGALVRLQEEVQEWLEYNVDVAEFNIKYIGLRSWLQGESRMSKEGIEHLRYLRHSLESECEEAQTIFGKLDTNPQPEHLRNLKDRQQNEEAE